MAAGAKRGFSCILGLKAGIQKAETDCVKGVSQTSQPLNVIEWVCFLEISNSDNKIRSKRSQKGNKIRSMWK